MRASRVPSSMPRSALAGGVRSSRRAGLFRLYDRWWLPGTVFFLLAVGVVALWWQMRREERRRVRLETEVTAEQMRLRLESWVDARGAAVSHLAGKHSPAPGAGLKDFQADAEELMAVLPGFQAINWVSPEGVIELVVPQEGNEGALGRNLFAHPDPDVASALGRAMQTGAAKRTRLVELFQGGTGIGAYWPAQDEEGRLDGFVNGVFDVQQLIDICFAEERLKREFVYAFGGLEGEVAYEVGSLDDEAGEAYEHEVTVQIIDRPWRLRVRPSAALLERAHQTTDEVILVLGLCLATAVAFLMQLILVRQRELEASEGRIRHLLNSTGEAILGVDGAGRCTLSNPACAEVLGYSSEEDLIGRGLHEILHEGEGRAAGCGEDCPLRSMALLKAGRKQDEIELVRKDGSRFLAELSAYPIAQEGFVEGVVIVFVDRTERQAMQAALKSSEELFRAITENSSDITVILSREGRYKYVSPAMESLIGHKAEVFLGRNPEEVGHIHPEDQAKAKAAAQEAWRKPKQPVPLPPVRVRRADGTWAYLENLYMALPGVTGVDGLVVHCREVTERVLAEQEIQASKQMLQLVLDSIPVRVFWKDRDSKYLGGNAAFASDAGLASAEEIAGKTDADMPWAAYMEAYRRDDLEVMGSGRPMLQFEEPMVKDSGGPRWVRTSKVPLRGLDGEVAGVMGCYEDTTEARLAEQALRESEENYRALIEGASEMICVVHESGEVLLANPPAARVLGETPEALRGRRLQELLPAERVEVRMALFQRAIELGKEYRGETGEVVDGEEVVYATSVKPLRNKEGRYDRVLVIASDITEQRRSEKALREGEARYRLLADNVTDVIWTIDLALNVTYVSPSVENLLGYTARELTALGLRAVMEAPAYERILRIVTVEIAGEKGRMGTSGGYPPMELRLSRKDGRVVWTESTTKVLRDEQGRPVGVQGSSRDITRRKEIELEKASLEHQLVQSQKMEAVGTLAGGIAHDFNNLLTGVLGYANLLKLGSAPGEEVYESADVIERAADRAAQLTRQLLGFARKGKLLDTPVDVHQTIQEVIALLSRTVNKKIEISQRLRAQTRHVKGDPTQLQQVVLNLAVNARDAMPEGGQLTFQTDNVTFDAGSSQRVAGLADGTYLVVSVTDTGSGIPEEIRDRIFEPFFTTKEQGKGTGMGLATVYGIVKNHGGAAQLAHSSAEGTTMRLFLPVADVATEAGARPKATEGLHMGSGKVLVVDDENVVRTLATSMLEELGYEAVAFADPREAVQYFERERDDVRLVLLDMIMPHMNGLECFEALRGLRPGVPVVLSSGYGEDEVMQKAVDSGISGFVQKPYRLQTLSQVLEAALRTSGGPAQALSRGAKTPAE